MQLEEKLLGAITLVCFWLIKMLYCSNKEKGKILLEHQIEETKDMKEGFAKVQISITELSTKMDGFATRDNLETLRVELKGKIETHNKVNDEKLKMAEHKLGEAKAEHRASKIRIEGLIANNILLK